MTTTPPFIYFFVWASPVQEVRISPVALQTLDLVTGVIEISDEPGWPSSSLLETQKNPFGLLLGRLRRAEKPSVRWSGPLKQQRMAVLQHSTWKFLPKPFSAPEPFIGDHEKRQQHCDCREILKGN